MDLMFLIHGRNTGVTLDRALARGHLGRLVVGDVTFDFLGPFALAHPWAGRF